VQAVEVVCDDVTAGRARLQRRPGGRRPHPMPYLGDRCRIGDRREIGVGPGQLAGRQPEKGTGPQRLTACLNAQPRLGPT
jgi:hypothetical protein